MPSTAARSNDSSCSYFKSAFTPKVLFLTFIVSIALTVQNKSAEEVNCFICASIEVIVKTACALMDLFIMLIKSFLSIIVETKAKFDMLLQAVRCKSAGTTFKISDQQIKSINEMSPTLRRRFLSIEENRETVTSSGGETPPGSTDRQTRSFISPYLPKTVGNRPSRTKPIPSYVVIPHVSKTVNDIADELETAEGEEQNIQQLEEEVAKELEQSQDPGGTKVWRSESQDGPKELFELTKPVPIHADDGTLLGYDDGKGGVMQWDPQHGGYYLDENGDMIPLNNKLSKADVGQEKSSKKNLEASQNHDDTKKELLMLTISDEDWAANCDCTAEDEIEKTPTINCTVCDKETGKIRQSPSCVHWLSDCKCKEESKASVSVKSIQTPQDELKKESLIVSEILPPTKEVYTGPWRSESLDGPKQSYKGEGGGFTKEEVYTGPWRSESLDGPKQLYKGEGGGFTKEDLYTGPWRSESLDGPKQFYKGEGGGFTKEEEENYFKTVGKCSHYDDKKCKRCRCYRMKFTREEFKDQANLYKGSLANTGLKKKRKLNVRLSQDFVPPCDPSLGKSTVDSKSKTSLDKSTTDSKALTTDLKLIKYHEQPNTSSSEEQCRCSNTVSEINFKSMDCRCPSLASRHTRSTSQISSNEDRCRCPDGSKISQRINEMSNRGADCKCQKTESKSIMSGSQHSDKDDLCLCLDSDTKNIKSEIFSKSLEEIRCHCHDGSDAKLKRQSRGKNCKCYGTDLKQTDSVSQRSLNENNRCRCLSTGDAEKLKNEHMPKSKDCKCPSSDIHVKTPVIKNSIKDYPCQCLNTSETNRLNSEMFYKKSKDCKCPKTVSIRSNPIPKVVVLDSGDKDTSSKKTTDVECLTDGLCCLGKPSESINTKSKNDLDSKPLDTKHTQVDLSIKSTDKISSEQQTVVQHQMPIPKRLGHNLLRGVKDENFEQVFLKLRAAKTDQNLRMHALEQKRQCTQCPSNEQYKIDKTLVVKKKKNKRRI